MAVNEVRGGESDIELKLDGAVLLVVYTPIRCLSSVFLEHVFILSSEAFCLFLPYTA